MHNRSEIIRSFPYTNMKEHNLPDPFGPTTAVKDFRGPIISFPL